MDNPKIKVRIALAILPTGEWNAAGNSHWTDAQSMDTAVDILDGGETRYIIEVEVPVPQYAMLEGAVIPVPRPGERDEA